MEMAAGGTLKQLLLKRRLTENESALIVRGILKAVEHMHLNDIVHRDLKPENILLDDCDDFSTVKIADFGLSVHS
jgi:serine/threonine protein kinase